MQTAPLPASKEKKPGVNSIARTVNPDHLPMIDHLAMSIAALVAEVMFECELSMLVCGDRAYALALLDGLSR